MGVLKHERTASLSPSRVCVRACLCVCVVRDECSADLSELRISPAATLSHLQSGIVTCSG